MKSKKHLPIICVILFVLNVGVMATILSEFRIEAGILDALFAVLLVLFVICVMSSRG